MSAPPQVPGMLEWVKDVALPVAGFLGGFFTSRWTMTKKDRKDVEQKNYENTTKLLDLYDSTYQEYAKSIATYNNAPSASGQNFFEIATKGDRYLQCANHMSGAIMSDKVDVKMREDFLLPKLRSVAERTLPLHYAVLNEIAKKQGFHYIGELRRSDYSAIYSVVEKFGTGPAWE